jgi:hypothetical protein
LFDESFWNRILLQIAQSEPTVWHAIIAVSSLDEQCMSSFGRETISTAARRDALAHYNKGGVGRLRATTVEKQESVEAILVSCLLFVCIELLLQNGIGAMAHVQGSAKIIQGWKTGLRLPPPSKSSIMEDDLVPIFDRLELMVASFNPLPSLEKAVARPSEKMIHSNTPTWLPKQRLTAV